MEVFIKKFAELENCNFTAPCTIEGKNKLGKTTILNAVSWCLFGKNIYGNDMGVAIYAEHDTPEERFADVSITIAGETYQRTANSTFTREGKMKSRISTTCKINEVEMTETEYAQRIGVTNIGKISVDLLCTNPLAFLNLEYRDKRMILDDVVKRTNPELAAFDFNAAIEERKSAKRAVSANAREQESERKSIKNVQIPNVTPISKDLQDLEEQYQAAMANSEAINKMIADNNDKIAERNNRMNAISNEIGKLEFDRIGNEKRVVELENLTFAPFLEKNIPEIDEKLYENAKNEYESMPIYSEIKEFWVGENKKYSANTLYLDLKYAYETACNMEFSGIATCPVSGAECPTASEAAEKAFEAEKADKVKAAKQRLLNYINDLFATYRSHYEQAKHNYETEQSALANAREEREKAVSEQKILKSEYEKSKAKFESDLQADKTTAYANLQAIEKEIAEKRKEFDALKNTPLELQDVPQAISEELTKAHYSYTIEKERFDAECGMEKYAKGLVEKFQKNIENLQIKQQENLQRLDAITQEIMDYVHNLEDVLTLTFSGKYRINFVMTSQTLDGEINDDVCEVIVSGRKHLNEATMVNAGMQILNGLRKIYNKNTPVLIDRTESVNEVDTYGNDVIMTKVTMDNSLIYKPINN